MAATATVVISIFIFWLLCPKLVSHPTDGTASFVYANFTPLFHKETNMPLINTQKHSPEARVSSKHIKKGPAKPGLN
jgi:hypothetical protein